MWRNGEREDENHTTENGERVCPWFCLIYLRAYTVKSLSPHFTWFHWNVYTNSSISGEWTWQRTKLIWEVSSGVNSTILIKTIIILTSAFWRRKFSRIKFKENVVRCTVHIVLEIWYRSSIWTVSKTETNRMRANQMKIDRVGEQYMLSLCACFCTAIWRMNTLRLHYGKVFYLSMYCDVHIRRYTIHGAIELYICVIYYYFLFPYPYPYYVDNFIWKTEQETPYSFKGNGKSNEEKHRWKSFSLIWLSFWRGKTIDNIKHIIWHIYHVAVHIVPCILILFIIIFTLLLFFWRKLLSKLQPKNEFIFTILLINDMEEIAQKKTTKLCFYYPAICFASYKHKGLLFIIFIIFL